MFCGSFGNCGRGELDALEVCATPFLHLPIAAFVARIKSIPLVLTCHEALLAGLPDYVRERGNRNAMVGGLLTFFLAGIYRCGMSRTQRRIAVSRRTADALQGEGFPPSAMIEFGLEPEVLHAPEPVARTGSVRFVFCGRLTPIKSVDRALEALLSLRGEGASFHFDIIGEGSERPCLEKMVDAANARSVVTFHGELGKNLSARFLPEAKSSS